MSGEDKCDSCAYLRKEVEELRQQIRELQSRSLGIELAPGMAPPNLLRRKSRTQFMYPTEPLPTHPALAAKAPSEGQEGLAVAPPDFYSNINSGPSSEDSSDDGHDREELSSNSDPKADTRAPVGGSASTAPKTVAQSNLGGSHVINEVNDDEGDDADYEGDDYEGDYEGDYDEGEDENVHADDERAEEEEEEGDDEEAREEEEEQEEGNDSGSSQAEEDEPEDDKKDRFPYEQNIFFLSEQFQLEKRMATGGDAIVYRAHCRSTGELVAVKIRDDWNKHGKHPKEVRILSVLQEGHPNISTLYAWHNFPETKCHAVVTKLLPNTDIEHCLFNHPHKIRKFMHDLLSALEYIHSRNVLYRDVKPSNILWNEKTRRATMIDFDCATFFSPERCHRRCIGTDGYMAPEVLQMSSLMDKIEDQLAARKKELRDKLPRREYRAAMKAYKIQLYGTLPKKGYNLQVDVWSSGVVFGQLLFSVLEEDVTDDNELDAKGEGFVRRVLEIYGHSKPTFTPKVYNDSHDLLLRMLTLDPEDRITITQALQHPYFSAKHLPPLSPKILPMVPKHRKSPLPAAQEIRQVAPRKGSFHGPKTPEFGAKSPYKSGHNSTGVPTFSLLPPAQGPSMSPSSSFVTAPGSSAGSAGSLMSLRAGSSPMTTNSFSSSILFSSPKLDPTPGMPSTLATSSLSLSSIAPSTTSTERSDTRAKSTPTKTLSFADDDDKKLTQGKKETKAEASNNKKVTVVSPPTSPVEQLTDSLSSLNIASPAKQGNQQTKTVASQSSQITGSGSKMNPKVAPFVPSASSSAASASNSSASKQATSRGSAPAQGTAGAKGQQEGQKSSGKSSGKQNTQSVGRWR